MALHNEAAFQDALSSAVEEAVNEVESVEDEAPVEDEQESLDESPESEEIQEDSDEFDRGFVLDGLNLIDGFLDSAAQRILKGCFVV